MPPEKFFDEQRDQSEVKATIVEGYMLAWAGVMKSVIERTGGQPRIAYIDLFAGPGRYRDGAKSTPVRVIERAIQDPWLRQALVTIFNDKDEEHVRELAAALREVPGYESLRFKPQIRHGEVGEELVQAFEGMKLVPTLFFVDPFGYKGLSLRLINSVLKDWGCDAIIFFNFNRINMGVSNLAVEPHMRALFGEERLERLRVAVNGLDSRDREETVINEAAAALVDMAGQDVYVLPFRFRRANGSRTSHYLIFVSKDVKGLDVMKQVMARSSSLDEAGVPHFEYNPGYGRQPELFGENRIDLLSERLATHFVGRSIGFDELYQEYEKSALGTPFLRKHYRAALKRLEETGRLDFRYRGEKRRRFTYDPLKTTIVFTSAPEGDSD